MAAVRRVRDTQPWGKLSPWDSPNGRLHEVKEELDPDGTGLTSKFSSQATQV